MTAAPMLNQFLRDTNACDSFLRDSETVISRDRACRIMNYVAKSCRSLVEDQNPRIGLIMERSVLSLLVMTGLSLAGADVFLLKAGTSDEEVRAAQRTWNLQRVMGVADVLPDRSSDLTQVPLDLIDFGTSIDAPFFTVLSSGTSGIAKAVTHSFESALGSATAFSNAMGSTPRDIYFHNWPLFYMAGIFNLFLCPLVSGAEIFLSSEFTAKDVRRQFTLSTEVGTSQLLLSPTMAGLAVRAIAQGTLALGGTNVICTSSILYPSIQRRFLDVFAQSLRPCYGITEFGGSFTLGGAQSKAFSVGKPVSGIDIRVMDGEIHVKSPYVAPTIRKVDGQVVNLTATDFHPTSDLGTVDDDGELYVLGRVGDQIKKGGEFLSLIEIENVVLSLPAVKDCLSIPCLSELWGQDFVLLVVASQPTKRGSESLEQQILRAISGAMGPRALPSRIDVVELIARTDSGKALRRAYLFENSDNESGHVER